MLQPAKGALAMGRVTRLGMILAAAGTFSTAHAEIVKLAVGDCAQKTMCLYWWPKLPEMKGWHSDQRVNLSRGENGLNVLIPNGMTFGGAPAIIYGSAVYRPRYDADGQPKSTLDTFIADDRNRFEREGL
jgi:hypothetical protein